MLEAAQAHEADLVADALRRLFAHTSVGFVLLDPQLRFVVVNDVMAQVNGLPVAEHLGRFVGDVLPGLDEAAIEALRRVLETGEPLRDVEVSGTVPASPVRHVWLEDFVRVESSSGAVVGVASIVTDVTAERLGARRLRQLIDSLFSFVGLCTPDGTLVEANRSAVEAAGVRLEDVLGRPFWDTWWFTWNTDVVARIREAVAEAGQGRSIREDVEIRVATGSMTIDFQLVPVVEDGEVVALVPSATDVTARRRSVEQASALGTLARRLAVATTVDDVVTVVHEAVPAAAGARAAAVATDPEHFGELRLDAPDAAADDDEGRARVETVAELVGQSLRRARLADARSLAARRTGALAVLAAELASANTLDEVRAAVDQLAPPVVGARSAALGLVDADSRVVRVAYGPSYASGLAQRYSTQRADVDLPHAVAVRTGRMVLLPDRAAYAAQFPHVLPDVLSAGVHAGAAVPVRDSRDRVIGAIGFGWADPLAVDDVLVATLDTIGELCGQTVERARLHADEHEFVDALQRRFLRPLPETDVFDLAATYRAAQSAVGIGGDFYDAIVLDGGQLAVLLGDVAGHGMAAAADMAQLRTVLSTLLAAGTPLDELFRRADPVLGRVAGTSLATAAAAVVDPAADTLAYVHAGHPPLVLRRPDGTVCTLDDARGALLGLDLEQVGAAVVPFPAGSVLVGYTDGLVETRHAPLDDGIARVVEAVASCPPDAGAAAIGRVLLEHCVGTRSLEDDVAVLVVRRP